jgi:hypothetical protein
MACSCLVISRSHATLVHSCFALLCMPLCPPACIPEVLLQTLNVLGALARSALYNPFACTLAVSSPLNHRRFPYG